MPIAGSKMSKPNSVSLKFLFSTSLTLVFLGSPLVAKNHQKLALTESLQALHQFEFAGFVNDDGAANRIVAAERLRSLSQEVPAAVCHLHNNIDVDEATEVLESSVAAFDFMADALLNGNEDIGIIGAEQKPKSIVEIEALIESWQPIRIAALAVLSNPLDADAAQIVYSSDDDMFEKTYSLLTHIEGEYSNPTEILQSDLMLLEVSGRMAALSQRLAFEACLVWSGAGNAEVVADLLKTMGNFEASRTALHEGMPALGILPPPNAEIAAKLEEISDHWDDVHDALTHVASGADIPVPEREILYHDLITKLHQIEELEELYQNYSKRIY